MKCVYGKTGVGRVPCEREACRGWTTCKRHKSAGISRRAKSRLAESGKRRSMLTAQEIAAVPASLDIDPHMSFADAVWHAQIELDLIAEGQEAAEHYTRRQVRQIQKFVNDNRASLASSGRNGGAA